MTKTTGINRQSTLTVTKSAMNYTLNRWEIDYSVLNEIIEPTTTIDTIKRVATIRNIAATEEQTDPDTGEVISPATPANPILDEFRSGLTSVEQFDALSESEAIAHAEEIGIFVEYIDPTIDAWEAETGTPEPANTTPWEPDVFVATGMKRSYSGEVYLVLQSHTTQADWTPDVTPALFKLLPQSTGGLPIWVQPSGAGDSYGLGAQVKRGTICYESAVANNVWMPGGPGIGDNIWFQITCP